jgi:hypothetical protein
MPALLPRHVHRCQPRRSRARSDRQRKRVVPDLSAPRRRATVAVGNGGHRYHVVAIVVSGVDPGACRRQSTARRYGRGLRTWPPLAPGPSAARAAPPATAAARRAIHPNAARCNSVDRAALCRQPGSSKPRREAVDAIRTLGSPRGRASAGRPHRGPNPGSLAATCPDPLS